MRGYGVLGRTVDWGLTMARASFHLSRAEGKLYLGKAPNPGRYTRASKARRTVDGHVFDSLAEVQRYGELKVRELLGEVTSIRFHVPFDCVVNGVHVLRYTVDFAYMDRDRGQIFEEVKSGRSGQERDWRLRRKLVEALHSVKIDEVAI